MNSQSQIDFGNVSAAAASKILQTCFELTNFWKGMRPQTYPYFFINTST
jgi:hypothetical protein